MYYLARTDSRGAAESASENVGPAPLTAYGDKVDLISWDAAKPLIREVDQRLKHSANLGRGVVSNVLKHPHSTLEISVIKLLDPLEHLFPAHRFMVVESSRCISDLLKKLRLNLRSPCHVLAP